MVILGGGRITGAGPNFNLRALMTNIPYMYIAFTFLEQPFSLIINQNVNIVSIIEKTTSNFPSVQMYIKQF